MPIKGNRQQAGILAPGRARVLLISPIEPSSTGNGLAMRAAAIQQGLGNCAVHVVPLAGGPSPDLNGDELARSWLKHERGRDLLTRVPELPDRARLGAPALGEEALNSLGNQSFEHVYLLRSYAAGCVLPLRRAWPEARFTLDVDEDDAAVAREIADLVADPAQRAHWVRESERYAAFLTVVSEWFDDLVASSPTEAKKLGGLLRREVHCVVNRPHVLSTDAQLKGIRQGILFVGNLDYCPNRDALERLLGRILPLLHKRHPRLALDVVGKGAADLAARFSEVAEVRWHGYVEDLQPFYARAAMALVPLRAGGGSRIKLLEAMALGLPIVSTAKAAEGLEVADGEHLLLAETDSALADAADRLLRDPDFAATLARHAAELVRRRYSPAEVYDQLGRL
ncbi:MAG: glycosyltransferase family 4 protein [Pseudomonadota bacterium]